VGHVGAYLMNAGGKYVDQETENVGGPLVDPLYDAARASALDADKLAAAALESLKKGEHSDE
jgi:hypothetical protein